MRSSLYIIFLTLPMAAALNVKINTSSIICEDSFVTMSLGSVCGDIGECQLGVEQYAEGSFIYEGLQDQFSDSITSNSSLLLDATLQLSVGQYKTMQYKLIEQDVPICSAFEASRYNQYGDCPADGEYSFDTPFDLPAAKSSFADWAVSGYDGAVVIKIYFDSSLVGQCSIQASTIQSQSSKMPSGKIGAMAVATLIFLSLLYIISICLVAYCCKKRKGRVATDVDSENSDSLSEPSTRYSRMEAGSAVQRTDNAADFQPVQGPTRSFGAGSLI